MKNESYQIALMALERYGEEVPQCQEPGCSEASMECMIVGATTDDDLREFYCPTHAERHGFCWGCGCFIAGTNITSDLCENCEAEMQHNQALDDEDWDGIGPPPDDY